MRVGKKYFSLRKAFAEGRITKSLASFLAVTLFLTNFASTSYAQDTPPVYTINTDGLTLKAASEVEPREVNLALNDLSNSSKMLQYSPTSVKSDEIRLAEWYSIPGSLPIYAGPSYPGSPSYSGSSGGGGECGAGCTVFVVLLSILTVIGIASIIGNAGP